MINKDVGWLIKETRSGLGMTQRELAKRLKISDVHMCNLEKGKATWTLANLCRAADILGVEFEVASGTIKGIF